jgi:hypothetical protein
MAKGVYGEARRIPGSLHPVGQLPTRFRIMVATQRGFRRGNRTRSRPRSARSIVPGRMIQPVLALSGRMSAVVPLNRTVQFGLRSRSKERTRSRMKAILVKRSLAFAGVGAAATGNLSTKAAAFSTARAHSCSVVVLAPDTRPLPVVLPTRFRPLPRILTLVRGLYRAPVAAELDFSDTAQLKLTI